MAAVSQRAAVVAVSELNADKLKSMFIESASSAQTALDSALDRARKAGINTPKILVLPDGCVTVPDPGQTK
jgi:nickel-dependent lactate racemase